VTAVTTTKPTSATEANVASSGTSATLFAASSSTNKRTIWNDSAQALYVKFGATASTSSFTVKVPAGGHYEFPEPVYAGRVDGIWASADGFARLSSW
jgi:hypothetical protein